MAYRHIMGEDDEQLSISGQIANPETLNRLFAAPHIQEFIERLGLGTYPPWADPSFGYDGTPPRFHLRRQLNRIHVVWRYYFDLYVIQLGGLLYGFLVLLSPHTIRPNLGRYFLAKLLFGFQPFPDWFSPVWHA